MTNKIKMKINEITFFSNMKTLTLPASYSHLLKSTEFGLNQFTSSFDLLIKYCFSNYAKVKIFVKSDTHTAQEN